MPRDLVNRRNWEKQNLIKKPERAQAKREYARKWRAANRDRQRASEKRWIAKNPERVIAIQRKYRGLPEAIRPCPPRCEVCGRLPGKQRLHLDHCHETGKFRGWLCFRCNGGLGLIGDTITAVKRMLTYLENNL